jgi:hypothetical protein
MVAPLGKLATDDLKEYQAWRVGGCIESWSGASKFVKKKPGCFEICTLGVARRRWSSDLGVIRGLISGWGQEGRTKGATTEDSVTP